MAILPTNFSGETFVGLFGFATDSYALLTNRLSKRKYEDISDALGVETAPASVSSISLVGIMAAGNSNGLLLPYTINNREYESLKKFNAVVLDEKFTALGNLIACNDKGAIISEVISEKSKAVIEDTLAVDVYQRSIGNRVEVGALCVATNKGFVVTPDAKDNDLKELKRIFRTDGGKASANFGSKVVGACIIANSSGCVVGEETSSVELQHINEALNFI